MDHQQENSPHYLPTPKYYFFLLQKYLLALSSPQRMLLWIEMVIVISYNQLKKTVYFCNLQF